MPVAFCRTHATVDRRFHIRPAFPLAIEAGQCRPVQSRMWGGGNCVLVLALGRAVVLASLGDARAQLMGTGHVYFVQLRGHLLCLAGSAPNHRWSFLVKLAKIGERLGVARIELCRFLKLAPYTLAEGKRAHEGSTARF